jgi:hypothetical protein
VDSRGECERGGGEVEWECSSIEKLEGRIDRWSAT